MTQVPTAIVADDEANLRAYLEQQLGAVWPELSIVASVGNGRAALEAIDEYSPDVAFLDIKMPGVTGLDVAARLEGDTRVVFVTAYDEFAVAAFENAAVDYLLKPIEADRLALTVSRLRGSLGRDTGLDRIQEAISQLVGARRKYLNWVKVGQAGETRVVPTDEIIFFKAEHKYTTVRTVDGELLIRRSIKELEAELDPEVFWRVHRSTLVNARFIEVAKRDFRGRFSLTLRGASDVLKVSDTYAHLFRQM